MLTLGTSEHREKESERDVKSTRNNLWMLLNDVGSGLFYTSALTHSLLLAEKRRNKLNYDGFSSPPNHKSFLFSASFFFTMKILSALHVGHIKKLLSLFDIQYTVYQCNGNLSQSHLK